MCDETIPQPDDGPTPGLEVEAEPKPGRTFVAPPPAAPPRPPQPPSVTEFTVFLEFVDKKVPYVKLKRTVHWSLIDDASTGLGDHGEWTDLRPDQIEAVPLKDSPAVGLKDQTPEEDQEFEEALPDTVVLLDGGIRGRLGEIGVSRYEWERLDAATRQTIKAYLLAEADMAQVVVAAALIPADDAAKEYQKKARAFLAQVTEDLADRGRSTLSPLRAIQRDRAWHEAQPLLARLTELLSKIEEGATKHDLVNEPTWLAEQVAVVNAALTSFPRERYYAYCTPQILSTLKTKHARTLAREIAHHFHRDASLDDLSRSYPPRQRPSSNSGS